MSFWVFPRQLAIQHPRVVIILEPHQWPPTDLHLQARSAASLLFMSPVPSRVSSDNSLDQEATKTPGNYFLASFSSCSHDLVFFQDLHTDHGVVRNNPPCITLCVICPPSCKLFPSSCAVERSKSIGPRVSLLSCDGSTVGIPTVGLATAWRLCRCLVTSGIRISSCLQSPVGAPVFISACCCEILPRNGNIRERLSAPILNSETLVIPLPA